jgi:hypothetical protein
MNRTGIEIFPFFIWNEMDNEKKEFGKWWIWVLFLLALTIISFSALNYLGIIGKTVVERKVFEQSYQRSESLKSEIATYEAQLAMIEAQLSGDLEPLTRANLNAQVRSIKILLSAARRKQ